MQITVKEVKQILVPGDGRVPVAADDGCHGRTPHQACAQDLRHTRRHPLPDGRHPRRSPPRWLGLPHNPPPGEPPAGEATWLESEVEIREV